MELLYNTLDLVLDVSLDMSHEGTLAVFRYRDYYFPSYFLPLYRLLGTSNLTFDGFISTSPM